MENQICKYKLPSYSLFNLFYGVSLVLVIALCCGCTSEHEVEEQTIGQEKPNDENSDVYLGAKYLLEANELSTMLANNDSLLIIEVSKPKAFEVGHIPGAVRIWRPDYNSKNKEPYGGMRASKEEMEALLSRLGAYTDTPILVYDTKGSVDAIRFIWMLEMYGHESVFLLNGGKEAWKQAGFELTTQQTTLRPVSHYKFLNTPDYSFLASMEDVKKALQDTNVILLDTREPEEFLGQPYIHNGAIQAYKNGAFTNGCIPGAIHINWSKAVDLNGDHRFYSLKRLKRTFLNNGIQADRPIITYCQSGVRSMHTTYVLRELLGFTNVKNYDGSWIEWSYFNTKDGSVAVERHSSPEKNVEIREQLEQQLNN